MDLFYSISEPLRAITCRFTRYFNELRSIGGRLTYDAEKQNVRVPSALPLCNCNHTERIADIITLHFYQAT